MEKTNQQPQATPRQVAAAFTITLAVTEAIREGRRVPRGHLYAAVMSKGVDMAGYEKVERVILDSGLVRREGQELVWIGPEVRA